MKRLVLGIFLALFSVAPLTADDFVYHGSFMWNDIRAVVHRGDFLFCAFHDGVGTINLTQDFNKKKLYSLLELSDRPRRLHLFDTLLVVENETGTVDFVNVVNPADMSHLGSFTPGFEIFDLEMLDGLLYAAIEYDGLMRYDISDPTDVVFDDSSMAGIRVTKLDVYDNRLYVLDDYNGILIYEPDPAGIGAPVSELLLPQQAISFMVFNDTVYAGIRPSGYMVGSVDDVYNPQYQGERTSFIRADFITGTTQGLVIANSISGFELIYNGDGQPGELFPLSNIIGYPRVYYYDGRNWIIYPHERRGFVVFDIDNPAYIDLEYPDLIYAYPGPITQLQFLNSRLHVVGVYNWYEIYDVSDPANPFRSGKMINPPYRPIGMCNKGDTIFVADLATNTIFPAVDDGFGDPFSIFPFFSVADSISRPEIIPDYFGDMDLLYFINDHRLNGSARDASVVVPNLIRWSFPTGITAAFFDGNLFYRMSDKSVLFIYIVEHDYELTELVTVGLSARVNDVHREGNLMYIAANGLQTYSLGDPVAPVLVDSKDDIGSVYEIQAVGSWLICATHTGIHVFDIIAGIPQPLFSGGSRAMSVACSDNYIAASDSYSVKIYTMPVSGIDVDLPNTYEIAAPRLYGYPNPFNPEITLVLENFGFRPFHLNIDVYDILGRRVRRLPIAVEGTARPQVNWDGRDEEGRPLPSGIYLFQAGDKSQRAVYKAILIK